MRGYNQMNLPRGTQSRGNPPATKAAAPQDSDPATQALRGPNSLKTTKSKTDTKTTGSGKQSPSDVNTDVMRGFHNPDYAEQDENWVRNDDFLTDVNSSLQKVVDSKFTEWDVINQIITNERLAELWGHIPIIGYKDDARAAEMEASIDEVAPHIPGNLPFTEKDIASARVGVIVDVKQLAAHGGGTKEQRKEATRQIWQRTIIQWLLGLGLDHMVEPLDKIKDPKLKKKLETIEKIQDVDMIADLVTEAFGIQDEESRKRLERLAEKALKTQRYLASLQMYDMYYRVSLKQWRQNPSLGAIAGGAYQIENFGNEPTVLIYFRPTTGANGSKGFRTLFVLREDTMEVIWP